MQVEANGISVHYRIDGPCEDSSAVATLRQTPSTVTLSHSLATSLDMWGPQMAPLASRFRVLRYDTRGHGRTEVPNGPYPLEMLVEDVRGLLLSLGITKTHFIGISLGGMVGQLLAATYPEMLSSLVLCDTSSRTEAEAGPVWDERIAIAGSMGMETLVEPTIGRWFTPGFVAARPEVIDPVRAMIRDTDPRGYAGCAAAVKTLDVEGRLREIRVPTLVMVGEEDPGTPVEKARATQGKIEGAELAVLRSASHLCSLEQPEAFNRTVMGFLQKVEAGAGTV